MLEQLAHDLDGSFESVVRAYQDALFSIALGIASNREDAEEIAQDAFIRAYRALQNYDAERIRSLHLKPWLVQIAVNVARNRLRRSRPVEIPLNGDHDTASVAEDPGQYAERFDETRRWHALLGAIPLRYRVPVVLRHVEGMSYAEIAQALGRPVGTVKVHVHRGLMALQDLLAAQREEVFIP